MRSNLPRNVYLTADCTEGTRVMVRRGQCVANLEQSTQHTSLTIQDGPLCVYKVGLQSPPKLQVAYGGQAYDDWCAAYQEVNNRMFKYVGITADEALMFGWQKFDGIDPNVRQP